MATYAFYTHDDDTVRLSINQSRYPGVYDSEETAHAVARAMDWQEVEDAFSHIYTCDGQERPVTMADFYLYKENK